MFETKYELKRKGLVLDTSSNLDHLKALIKVYANYEYKKDVHNHAIDEIIKKGNKSDYKRFYSYVDLKLRKLDELESMFTIELVG